MMARASGSIPTYTPSLYLPGSFGRYRQYPRVVRTSIPGAGVTAGHLTWGSQQMNLWGAPVAAFNNDRAPLLGLGQVVTALTSFAVGLGVVGAGATGLIVGYFLGKYAQRAGLALNGRRRRSRR